MFSMAMSTESIIALVSVLVALPPSILVIMTMLRRYQFLRCHSHRNPGPSQYHHLYTVMLTNVAGRPRLTVPLLCRHFPLFGHRRRDGDRTTSFCSAHERIHADSHVTFRESNNSPAASSSVLSITSTLGLQIRRIHVPNPPLSHTHICRLPHPSKFAREPFPALQWL